MGLGRLISYYNKDDEYSMNQNDEYSFDLDYVIAYKINVTIPKTSLARNFNEENKMEITLRIPKLDYQNKDVQNLKKWSQLSPESEEYYRDLSLSIIGTDGYENSKVFTHASILINECFGIDSDYVIMKVYATQKRDKLAGVVLAGKLEDIYKEAWDMINNKLDESSALDELDAALDELDFTDEDEVLNDFMPLNNYSDDSSSLDENFDIKRGDLIYGLGTQTKEYKENLKINCGLDSAVPLIIDFYINAIDKEIHSYQSPDLKKCLMTNKHRKYIENVKIPENLKELITSHKQYSMYPLWEDYFLAGTNNKKFNINYIYEQLLKNYESDDFHQIMYIIKEKRVYNGLLMKRASKIGIEMAMSNAFKKGTKIHFVLDGLNIKDIATKSNDGFGESVTSSELRYIFRNRDRAGDKIIFYKDNKSLDKAPWEEDPVLWSNYKPKSKSEPKPSQNNLLDSIS